MDTAQLASIIITVGSLIPLLTSLVEQAKWSRRTRTLVGVGISALAGLVTYVTQFGLNFSNPAALVSTVVGVILTAGAAYKTVWQPAGIAPALEAKSSPEPVPPNPEAPAAEVDAEDHPEVDDQWPEDDELLDEDVPLYELEQPTDFDDGSRPT